MKELIIAFGLFLFIEGIIYALFPSKMKNMLKKMETIKDSQLRTGGLILLLLDFLLFGILRIKMKKVKILFVVLLVVNFSFFANAKNVPESFADLAEKLMPSVVNISTTQTISNQH